MWLAVGLVVAAFGGLVYVVELFRRELRAFRTELRDWRHDLPASKTRTIRE